MKLKGLDKMIFNIKRFLVTKIGAFEWQGWKHPFWFVLYPEGYKMKGIDYQDFLINAYHLLEPGDILLITKEKFIASNPNLGIPGDFKHAGIFIGWKEVDGYKYKVPFIVEAKTREGVTKTHLFDAMCGDKVIIVRPNIDKRYRKQAAERAKTQIGKGYDFDFKYNNTIRFFCTELIGWSYDTEEIKKYFKFNITTMKKYFQTYRVLLADEILRSDVQIVWANREAKKTKIYNEIINK